jgi:hypothetical protein
LSRRHSSAQQLPAGRWRAVGSAAAGPLTLPALDASLAVAVAAAITITIAIGVTLQRGTPGEA